MKRFLAVPGLLLAVGGSRPAAAQSAGAGPPGSLILELGPQATFTIGDSVRFGLVAGPRFALRTAGGTRGSLALGAGIVGDSLSGRIEGAVEYQLAPGARGRPGIYFGGGLTGVLGGGRGGYLLLFVGLEQSPGGGSGWAVEAGLGGGFRIRGAYHWRKFPRGRR